MLNYSCRKVLNALIKIQKHNVIFKGRETLSKYVPKWIMKNIDSVMSYLYENEYITYMYAADDYYRFKLTYKGLAYKSFSYEEFKTFLLKSIIVPIFVAFITTLITLLLTELL